MSTIDSIIRAGVDELLARVAWSLDDKQAEAFAEHFTEDARITSLRRNRPAAEWRSGEIAAYVDEYHVGRYSNEQQTWDLDVTITPGHEAGQLQVQHRSVRFGSTSGGSSNVVLHVADVVDTVVDDGSRMRIAERVVTHIGAAPGATPGVHAASSTASSSPRPASPRSSEVTARLSDRLEILQLFAIYAWAVDTANIEATATLFAPEAAMADPFGRYVGPGPDGLRLFFSQLFARPEFAGRQHWVGQTVLEPTEEGYRADSYAVVPASFRGSSINLHLLTYYKDVLVRRDGRWCFLERIAGPKVANEAQPPAR